MRQSQLATLRAIQAGADTIPRTADKLGLTYGFTASRIAELMRDGYVETYYADHGECQIRHHTLTDKARSLLAERDRIGVT